MVGIGLIGLTHGLGRRSSGRNGFGGGETKNGDERNAQDHAGHDDYTSKCNCLVVNLCVILETKI